MLLITLAIALLAPLALAQTSPEDQKTLRYIIDMCVPSFWGTPDVFAAMANSPFPCEQEMHLSRVCFSNGTTEVDFLAEQQCLCGGNFFEAVRGCHECYFAHGVVSKDLPRDAVLSSLASASSAECLATPITMPYTNLYPVAATTGLPLAMLNNDRFPNDTAVSNYWTGAATPIAGVISGSATGRLTTRTNTADARYTPTGVTGSGAGGGGGTSSTGAPLPTSTNGAAEVRAAGGLLAVVIGVVAAL
ncbi:hypothetical protein V493_07265 [Pseudogymnoascus sp. VKM F-4281 (FW-2241)]|nr:hypothetical protein V493_07265 [Pseudogymnoascus sp. VKM F-4281 (FW-2241)]